MFGGPFPDSRTTAEADVTLDGYAQRLASAGDLDGDGAAELVIARPSLDTAWLLRGGFVSGALHGRWDDSGRAYVWWGGGLP